MSSYRYKFHLAYVLVFIQEPQTSEPNQVQKRNATTQTDPAITGAQNQTPKLDMIWILLSILLGISVPSSGSYSTHLIDDVTPRTLRLCNYVTKAHLSCYRFDCNPRSVWKPP